jgi:hypothetical protein
VERREESGRGKGKRERKEGRKERRKEGRKGVEGEREDGHWERRGQCWKRKDNVWNVGLGRAMAYRLAMHRLHRCGLYITCGRAQPRIRVLRPVPVRVVVHTIPQAVVRRKI